MLWLELCTCYSSSHHHHLHHTSSFRRLSVQGQVLGTSLHVHLHCAISFRFWYVPYIHHLQSRVVHLGLPLCFFPFILPSRISLNSVSPHSTWPIHFAWRSLRWLISCRFSPTPCNTSSLDTRSVHFIFSILRHIHISTASSLIFCGVCQTPRFGWM